VSFERLQRLPTAAGALKAWIANSDGGEVWLPGAHRATVTAGWTDTLPR
jgi:hypothetical protein